MVDIATKMAPYRHPRLEVTASLPVSKPIHSYTDYELKQIILQAYERERENAPPANGNGGGAILARARPEIVPYDKQR
jgi:hypothetical protein